MPTNEAKAAAGEIKMTFSLRYQDLSTLAETIDRETHLPALLAVAEAAREHLEIHDSAPPITDKDFQEKMKFFRRKIAANRVRLRAELAKLPRETPQ